jgi:ATPase family associated with various cellular activities (AAA)
MSAPAAERAVEADLILVRVRAHAALRTAWLRELWAAEGAPAGPLAVTHAEADAALAGADDPRAEAAWRAGAEAEVLVARAAAADAALEASPGRLARLAVIFGLDAADVDLMALAFAAAVDPAIARLCAYLHDHPDRAHASEALARRVFAHAQPGPWPPDAPVLRWRLVERRGGDAVAADPHIVAWLLGRNDLDGALLGRAELLEPKAPLDPWPVEPVAEAVRRALDAGPAARVRVIVRAGPGEGRRTFAAAVAGALGMPALAVRAEPVEPAARELLMRASRQAFLDGVAPVWVGAGAAELPFGAGARPFPIQFVVLERGDRPAAATGVSDLLVDLPAGATADRRRLWADHLPAAPPWPPAELDALAARSRATPGEIAAAAAAGPRSAAEAMALVQRQTASRAGPLVQRLECPFEAADLAIPARVREVLDDILHEAAVRTAFWEEPAARGMFPTGRALLALFAGPPGTGKTMAAQVIARELGFELWRVDLSALVSKWVGETAENVARLLEQAARADVVLLFDEADALYGKRATDVRDAQDRYVNMDTGHLMVAVEDHDGVVLLATNQKGAIDPAFLRRLRHVVDFPRPAAAQRLEIWRRLVAALAGDRAAAALSGELEALAEGVDATGAQIKYAVLGATLAARRDGGPVTAGRIVASLNRELGKEGRPLSARDVGRLVAT